MTAQSATVARPGNRLTPANPRGARVPALELAALSLVVMAAPAYALLVLLGAVSFLFFVRLRQDPNPRNAAGWAIASLLALLTHYFAVFIIAVEMVWLLVQMPSARRLLVAASVPVVVVGLAL